MARAGGPNCGLGAGGVTCGDRLATLIIYLRSPTRSGATVFPAARAVQLPTALQLGSGAATGSDSRQRSLQRQAAAGQPAAGEGGTAPAPAPWYCDPHSGVLQALPAPGDALFFW